MNPPTPLPPHSEGTPIVVMTGIAKPKAEMLADVRSTAVVNMFIPIKLQLGGLFFVDVKLLFLEPGNLFGTFVVAGCQEAGRDCVGPSAALYSSSHKLHRPHNQVPVCTQCH